MRAGALAFAFLLSVLPSKAETWSGPTPLPEGTLPAGIGGSYRSVASISFVSYDQLEDEVFVASYRYYLPYSIVDDDWPYRVQPFVQHASYLEGFAVDGMSDSNLFGAAGMYYFPAVRLSLGGSLGFGASPVGQNQSALGVDVAYYFTDAHDLALEIGIGRDMYETEEVGGGPPPRPVEIVQNTIDRYSVGARYVVHLPNAPAVLEVAAGYRHTDVEGVTDEGLAVEGRYFFNKQIFAGAAFSTEEARPFEVTGGYTAPENFHVEAALGTDDVLEDYFRIEVGLRF